VDVIAQGLDYSARRISGSGIRAAGYTFVNRYLYFPGQRWPSLNASEMADLAANGVEVHAIYEEGTNDPSGGYNGGAYMARQAVASASEAGLPAGRTIFMCADAWLKVPLSTAMAFLDGARSVIDPSPYVTGAYGFKDFIYAAQDGNHADRFWLCGADSGVRDGIHMYQWNNGTVIVGGVTCDLNKQYLPMIEGGEEDDMPYSPDEIKNLVNVAMTDWWRDISTGNNVEGWGSVDAVFKDHAVNPIAAKLDSLPSGGTSCTCPSARQNAEAVRDILKEPGN
jgi:hypothetical protein